MRRSPSAGQASLYLSSTCSGLRGTGKRTRHSPGKRRRLTDQGENRLRHPEKGGDRRRPGSPDRGAPAWTMSTGSSWRRGYRLKPRSGSPPHGRLVRSGGRRIRGRRARHLLPFDVRGLLDRGEQCHVVVRPTVPLAVADERGRTVMVLASADTMWFSVVCRCTRSRRSRPSAGCRGPVRRRMRSGWTGPGGPGDATAVRVWARTPPVPRRPRLPPRPGVPAGGCRRAGGDARRSVPTGGW